MNNHALKNQPLRSSPLLLPSFEYDIIPESKTEVSLGTRTLSTACYEIHQKNSLKGKLKVAATGALKDVKINVSEKKITWRAETMPVQQFQKKVQKSYLDSFCQSIQSSEVEVKIPNLSQLCQGPVMTNAVLKTSQTMKLSLLFKASGTIAFKLMGVPLSCGKMDSMEMLNNAGSILHIRGEGSLQLKGSFEGPNGFDPRIKNHYECDITLGVYMDYKTNNPNCNVPGNAYAKPSIVFVPYSEKFKQQILIFTFSTVLVVAIVVTAPVAAGAIGAAGLGAVMLSSVFKNDKYKVHNPKQIIYGTSRL